MNNVETLEQLLDIAGRLGFVVRFENLLDVESGVCQLGNQRVLFLDLNQNAQEHVEVVREVIEGDARFAKRFDQDRLPLREAA